jgi:ADP-ribose pyrophosphatase YjhB (NUDIX family)
MLYPAAKVIVRSKDKKDMILLVKRTIDNQTYYEPAGGRVDVNFEAKTAESLEDCARREILEELGVIVDIQNYIGSYYFFWSIDSRNISVCALFEGTITHVDSEFSGNKDSCELPIEPVWVSIESILNGSVAISPVYVGLEKLMKDYCHSVFCSDIARAKIHFCPENLAIRSQ